MTRTFASGATRDGDTGKHDYEGFLSPRVVIAFATYMHHNRELADGSMRASDNWQRGIPLEAYVKSAWRHFLDFWCEHRGMKTKEGIVWALCALLFNVQGYLDAILKDDSALLEAALSAAEGRRETARQRSAQMQLKQQGTSAGVTYALEKLSVAPTLPAPLYPTEPHTIWDGHQNWLWDGTKYAPALGPLPQAGRF